MILEELAGSLIMPMYRRFISLEDFTILGDSTLGSMTFDMETGKQIPLLIVCGFIKPLVDGDTTDSVVRYIELRRRLILMECSRDKQSE